MTKKNFLCNVQRSKRELEGGEQIEQLVAPHGADAFCIGMDGSFASNRLSLVPYAPEWQRQTVLMMRDWLLAADTAEAIDGHLS